MGPLTQGLSGHARGDDFETQWGILSSALREIHEKNASKLSFEQLYRASYKIVLKKQGDQLYDRVKEYEEQWFGGQVMPAIRNLITNNLVNITLGGTSGTTANERRITGEEFLKGLKASWEDHNTVMNMTHGCLNVHGPSLLWRQSQSVYLHNSHGPIPRSHPPITTHRFRSSYVRYPQFGHFRSDRHGERRGRHKQAPYSILHLHAGRALRKPMRRTITRSST